nr:hypothetical protein Iba_chr13cCG17470 [Ipomoea batatas]
MDSLTVLSSHPSFTVETKEGFADVVYSLLPLLEYSILIAHSRSPTIFISGRSARVGAAHWNANSNILPSISASILSLMAGSSMSIVFPSVNFPKACISISTVSPGNGKTNTVEYNFSFISH